MKVGFIGAGNMAGALIRGLVASGKITPDNVLVTDRSATRAPALAKELELTYLPDSDHVAQQAELLVMAVKPAQMSAVLAQIASHLQPPVTVVSLAAGFPLAAMRQALADGMEGDLPQEVKVIRAMPNVNALVGESMTALSVDGVSEADLAPVREVFDCAGKTAVIAESQFAAFSALAGCSPAWLYTVVDSLARAGVKHGLAKPVATQMVAQAMLGSAKLVLQQIDEGGASPQDLVDRVTSPGGTTIAGLLAAQEAGLAASLVRAVDAAVERDAQLSGNA